MNQCMEIKKAAVLLDVGGEVRQVVLNEKDVPLLLNFLETMFENGVIKVDERQLSITLS